MAREDAVQRVLRSPDLVALILEHLPVTHLSFGASCPKVEGRDRWEASQVNAVFRRAALRLPWEAQWGPHHYHRSSSPSLEALAFLGSRNVQTWHVRIYRGAQQSNRDSAAVLKYAGGTETLSISTDGNRDLMDWLHHTLPGAQEKSEQGVTVLARLASLSRLTSLRLQCNRYTGALWLSQIPQLRCIDLRGYGGPPLLGLPALESLRLECGSSEVSLEQWAAPRLTAVSLTECDLQLGSPPSGNPAHLPEASGSEAGLWLCRLQRLTLKWCSLSTQHTSLSVLVPALTCLKLTWCAEEQESVAQLLALGLPGGLKALCLEGESVDWSAVFGLQELVSLEVWQDEEFVPDEVAALVTGLMRLPHLQRVVMRLKVDSSDEARVEEGFKALDALLLDRQGGLTLDFQPP